LRLTTILSFHHSFLTLLSSHRFFSRIRTFHTTTHPRHAFLLLSPPRSFFPSSIPSGRSERSEVGGKER
jgi:hypothetical protein